MVYTVGKKVDSFVLHEECVQFDIDNVGATMLVFFNQPTQKEIEQFNTDKSFEIRFVELEDVIMVVAKIGSLNWVDAPYNVHLSQNLSEFTLPDKDTGLALTLILVDAYSGEIKSIRFMGLSTNFTKKLLNATIEQKSKSFNETEYDKNIASIYAKYTTDQLVKMSVGYCKIRG